MTESEQMIIVAVDLENSSLISAQLIWQYH